MEANTSSVSANTCTTKIVLATYICPDTTLLLVCSHSLCGSVNLEVVNQKCKNRKSHVWYNQSNL